MSIFSTQAFSETSFSDLGQVILEGSATLIGTSSTVSVAVGVLEATASLSANFTQTSVQTLISNGSSSQGANFNQSSNSVTVRTLSSDITANFTQSQTLSGTFLSSATLANNSTVSAFGELLYTTPISPTETWSIQSADSDGFVDQSVDNANWSIQ